VFHEPWWLRAVSGGTAQRVEVTDKDGRVVGFLPFVVRSVCGLKMSDMAPFTHVLGPVLDVGEGNSGTRLHNRFKITLELLEKLPQLAVFRQSLDCTVPEALAFQAAGFRVSPHYTIRIDCSDIKAVWQGMRQKTRRFIRRAQEDYEPIVFEDTAAFCQFFLSNLEESNRSNRARFDLFPALYEACRRHDSGCILAALDKKTNVLMAAIFVVWGHGTMYYLLTTRDQKNPDFGVVSLLVWRAMQEAHARGLAFDLDGIISTNIFRFLSGFGSDISARMIVQRESRLIEAVRPLIYNLTGRRLPTFF
jgi:hypothetical protein